MSKHPYPLLDDRHLVLVCALFLSGTRVSEIMKSINAVLQSEGQKGRLNRQQVYALLPLARSKGFFQLLPPANLGLEQRIADLYTVEKSVIDVVDAPLGASPGELVAERAARLALGRIEELWAKYRRPVHVGFAAGYTTMRVARHLSYLLRALPDFPPLYLHALTSGFRPDQPRVSPIAYFGFFDDVAREPDHIRYVGFLAPAVVETSQYKSITTQRPLSEAFKRRKEIDIVITSLANADDKHGDLNALMSDYSDNGFSPKKAGWVGDVQYRPFSASGLLKEEAGIRAVTLFELEELVDFARKPDKHVFLVSGRCGICERNRFEALLALLTVPELKVWSQIVMDRQTAEEIVTEGERRAQEEKEAKKAEPAKA